MVESQLAGRPFTLRIPDGTESMSADLSSGIRRLALSGLLCSGKDYVAERAGYLVLSFAEPMYAIAKYYFGHCDKTNPDIRKFLQNVGQWGWGFYDEDKCPYTPARAAVTHQLRRDGHRISGTSAPSWLEYGRKKTFWVDALLFELGPIGKFANRRNGRFAVTNCRFEHELKPLQEAGFEHYLVLCTKESRINRNGAPISREVDEDFSEQFARDLLLTLPPDRIIWNDSVESCPNPEYLTVHEFVKLATGEEHGVAKN